MRRYVASLVFAGCAALSASASAGPTAPDDAAAANAPSAPAVAVQQVRVPLPGVRDEAAMVLVGTALIGLAAAVRRAA